MSLLQPENFLYTSFPGGETVRYMYLGREGPLGWSSSNPDFPTLEDPLALAVNHADCFAFVTIPWSANAIWDMTSEGSK